MARSSMLAKVAGFMDGHKSAVGEFQCAVEGLRSKLRDLQMARSATSQAFASAEEVRARIAMALDSEEASARAVWPETLFSGANFDPNNAARFMSGVSKASVWGALCIGGLRSTVEDALIAAEMDNAHIQRLTDEERASALSEIDREIHESEVMIEKFIRAAEGAGIVITRDENARPEIYLAQEL
ncbi:hypothetical protein KD146_17480 [Devosia sp. BSSL-BM10]|uniref:Uncharacterized protein n=1 Tax=Devosia litorisediminis TaxID=2829817 RepID=A0A942IF68_9HYPH|nr:hypothetical protein [Devosia litorisediminis]MBS3850494.1 hypothetical protein [Devosia litorisediminis]